MKTFFLLVPSTSCCCCCSNSIYQNDKLFAWTVKWWYYLLSRASKHQIENILPGARNFHGLCWAATIDWENIQNFQVVWKYMENWKIENFIGKMQRSVTCEYYYVKLIFMNFISASSSHPAQNQHIRSGLLVYTP